SQNPYLRMQVGVLSLCDEKATLVGPVNRRPFGPA
ncbi:hypothetical protein IAE38_002190, partial [Pseudomonas sp. S32]|nr:hypothetical protein [Pseudomonas sp. S32]